MIPQCTQSVASGTSSSGMFYRASLSHEHTMPAKYMFRPFQKGFRSNALSKRIIIDDKRYIRLLRTAVCQVLRLEANVLFSRAPGAGAHLAAALRAAVKAGGCRHLWSLSVTLDDYDSSFFVNAPRKAEKTGGLATTAARTTRGGAATRAPSRQAPAHPMNALAFARAFHPRAPGGGAGAVLNEDDGDKATASGRGSNKIAAGAGRGSITSLGLPYARLHPRTIEELATHAISSLTHLDLSFCHIGAAGAVTLARALDGGGGGGGSKSGGGALRGRGAQSLRSLTLPHNFVGDSGACALGRALSHNHCLTFLSLASNGIGRVGGRALATALESTRGKAVDGGGGGLARLDVGDNPLGEKAARLLVDAAAAASGGGGGGGGGDIATVVQVLGLDRVAGATVATRAAAPLLDPADGGIGLERDGVVVPAASTTLVAVQEEVPVKFEDAAGDDELAQVTALIFMHSVCGLRRLIVTASGMGPAQKRTMAVGSPQSYLEPPFA